jgi:hypothetical protein
MTKTVSAPELAADLLKLNLGCGLDTPAELVNVDMVAGPGVDVVHDLDVAPWPWKPGASSYIKASHVFEHVASPVVFMTEAWRVLHVDGLLDIRVPGGGYIAPGLWLPHENGFTDPTHRRHCTPRTWDYWIPGELLFEAYGRGLGGGPGGACFVCTHLAVTGAQAEELWCILRKVDS